MPSVWQGETPIAPLPVDYQSADGIYDVLIVQSVDNATLKPPGMTCVSTAGRGGGGVQIVRREHLGGEAVIVPRLLPTRNSTSASPLAFNVVL